MPFIYKPVIELPVDKNTPSAISDIRSFSFVTISGFAWTTVVVITIATAITQNIALAVVAVNFAKDFILSLRADSFFSDT